MVFNPNIPQPTDDLSDSQGDILANFQSSNTSFGVDHYAFSDLTANNGRHKIIRLVTPNPNVNPAAIGGVGQLYSRQVTQYGITDEVLFYLSGGNRLSQLTAPRPPDTAGVNGVGSITRFSSLPGGYLLITGFKTNATDGSTINLSTTALTTILSIQLTTLGNSSSGTDRALVAQPRTVDTGTGTMVINLQDVNNNPQGSNRTVYFTVIGI